jgi:hypothetical protein
MRETFSKADAEVSCWIINTTFQVICQLRTEFVCFFRVEALLILRITLNVGIFSVRNHFIFWVFSSGRSINLPWSSSSPAVDVGFLIFFLAPGIPSGP